jgi:glucose-1-phosphate thymidylyltransferase
VADGVRLEASTVGPNVSIEEGAVVTGSTLRDVIVGRNARVIGCTVRHSLIDDEAEVRDRTLDNMVVARDEVAPAP